MISVQVNDTSKQDSCKHYQNYGHPRVDEWGVPGVLGSRGWGHSIQLIKQS